MILKTFTCDYPWIYSSNKSEIKKSEHECSDYIEAFIDGSPVRKTFAEKRTSQNLLGFDGVTAPDDPECWSVGERDSELVTPYEVEDERRIH